ncbi:MULTISPECIES: helix-turn-helix domain-containing protein [unclassified Amycolatopsis]|uniref:winged helix-turn-helix transcriptional regulator n=1 Tax=unclassified Amycolatopsis TaxID=2618356 RepID=UPI00210253EB|nr:helix-turn-helix domain-containing protein [Amycolatopsis sp. DSM 110486]
MRTVGTDVRLRVAQVPEPCVHWANRDADFVREVLDLVGDKWSVLLLGTLAGGPLRYSDLIAAVPAISQRMLTLTLKQLQRAGFVERTSHPEVPPRVEYTLTELGSSLLSAVLALGTWSTEHQARIRGNQAAFDAVESQEAEKPE